MAHSIFIIIALLVGFFLGYSIKRREQNKEEGQWENLFAYDGTKQEER